MATLDEIEAAISKTILGNTPDDAVFAYEDVPDVSQSPAIVPMPAPRDSADFTGAFGRGMTTWNIDVIIMVEKGSYSEGAQKKLSQLIDPANPDSIPRALNTDPTLGLTDGTDCQVEGIRLYGGKFENAQIDHVGAVMKVTVRTPGR